MAQGVLKRKRGKPAGKSASAGSALDLLDKKLSQGAAPVLRETIDEAGKSEWVGAQPVGREALNLKNAIMEPPGSSVLRRPNPHQATAGKKEARKLEPLTPAAAKKLSLAREAGLGRGMEMAPEWGERKALLRGDAIHWALGASLLAHAILMGAHFSTAPDKKSKEGRSAPLMAVIVNAQSPKPVISQIKAQTDLEGGGEEEDVWVPQSNEAFVFKGSLMAAQEVQPEAVLRKKTKKEKEQEARSALLALDRAKASAVKLNEELRRKEEELSAGAPREGRKTEDPLASSENSKEARALAAAIDERLREYASRPKKVFMGANAEKSAFAPWVEAWIRRVEKVGNEFYPPEAASKGSLRLTLTAAIKKNGTVHALEIDQTSGVPEVDRAAKQIVVWAGPFPKFSPEMEREADILYITRSWLFGKRLGLESAQGSAAAPALDAMGPKKP